MPTENRSSNTEQMVSVPRELLERCDFGRNTATALAALPELRAILAKPAAQHQGDPVALPSCKAKLSRSHDWDQGYSDGWKSCLEEVEKLGPLYTHADPAEVERLRKGISKHWKVVCDQRAELDTLRAQLAELDALFSRVIDHLNFWHDHPYAECLHGVVEDYRKLSASAEPVPTSDGFSAGDMADQGAKAFASRDPEVEELRRALGGMLFAFDDGVGRDWSQELLDYARKLAPAVEFKPAE